jgi:hypothetical protein
MAVGRLQFSWAGQTRRFNLTRRLARFGCERANVRNRALTTMPTASAAASLIGSRSQIAQAA